MKVKVLIKPILSIVILLFFEKTALSQIRTDTAKSLSYSEQYFWKKSKQQKKLGVASLVTGGIIAGVGGYVWFLAQIAGLSESGNVEGAVRTGKTLVIAGSSLAVLSIPLFIASSKNKKRSILFLGSSSLPYPVNGAKDLLCIGAKINLK